MSDSDAVLIAEVTRLRALLRLLAAACEELLDPSHECGANCDEMCPAGNRARAAIAAAKGAVR